jgi:sarcosine oxidase subunit alpha
MTKVRAGAVVFATGAIEQPLIFRNNDLPGVLLTSAAQRLLHRHAVAAGRRVTVACATRSGYEAALDLLERGVGVRTLIDLRPQPEDEDLARALIPRGVEILSAHSIAEAQAGGDGALRSITVQALRSAPGAPSRTIECDALLMNGGWAAATQLLLQAGGKVAFDTNAQMYLPASLPEGTFVAGRINGIFSKDAALADGLRAGQQAAIHAGAAAVATIADTSIRRVTNQPLAIQNDARGKDFVDFDEDLQVRDLQHAAQEGFDSVELLKRYTTAGMGPSQGKHSNVNAARVLAQMRQLPPDEIGLTTARPMYHPVAMKHLAGRGFTPERATPIEQRHRELSAVWMLAGNWRRPEYYARPDEAREQSIASEVAAVRSAVGLIDVGTLGKIEVRGPDAGLFLDRAYAARYSDLKIGMTRYGLLLDEAGTIIDDGVIARLHEHCFYFTTTTGAAATVYRELLRLNALWGLNCALVNVTGHRAAFNLAGPQSRALLSRLTSLDLTETAFPYLAIRETKVAGIGVRLMRVGFVGELGYEIHVPFAAAVAVWDALWRAGSGFNLRAFGVEAQRVLRLEKGHFIVGQDTDGLTNPFEARAAWAVKLQKPFFIGQRSLRILQRRGPRQLLAGFEIPTRVNGLKECHLVIEGDEIAGRITSVAYSQTLGKTIGLAMVKPSLASLGTELTMRLSDGALIKAMVCPTPFYDRDNLRQKMQEAA